MYIYKITNNVNGKIYIGQTIRPIEQRFRRHICDAESGVVNTHLARAIRKYGPSNFQVQEIDTANSQEELCQKEQYWIRTYGSIDSSIGYNETDALFKCGGNTYQSKTPEELAVIRDRLRSSKTGANNPQSKQIKAMSSKTGEIMFFESMADCRDYFGELNHQFVSRRCLGKIRCPYKDEWLFAFADEDFDLREAPPKMNKTRRHIRVTDLETGFSSEFKTYRDAERHFKLRPRSIQNGTHFPGEQYISQNKYMVTILD